MSPSPDTSARATPSLQWVPWPPLAGALRFPTDLPRYYGLLRLLPIRSYPSGRPLGPRTSPDGEEIESSLRFLDNPCGNMPRARAARDSGPQHDLAIAVAAGYCLPLGVNTSAS